ncbi:MAG: ADP-ribose pyrophosphatase [Anaerolineaceae bacterium]|nr:MAG: ADP-ribose pyrophosphatase [Anaerolineaceae bacterium]
MAYEVLKSEIIYPGRAFTIRRDHLRMPDGHETKFDIVEHGGSVIIVPLDAEGNLLFVRQYRHAAGLDLLELPAGVLEPGEEPEACAAREIREETGMAAGKMDYLGGFFLAPGYSTEYMHVYLATDLRADPLEADADEFLSLERIPLAEALALAAGGKIPDAKSLAAFCLAGPRLDGLK